MIMKSYMITRGGQIALPSAIRRRWGASRVVYEDLGDRVVVRPLPEDPISAFRGAFAGASGPNADEMRAQLREEERRAEQRRFG